MRIKTMVACALCALALSRVAGAELIINLGGGWQATIFDEGNVDVQTFHVSLEDNILVLEKFVNITSLDPLTQLPEPPRIAFQQIAPDEETVSRIVFRTQNIFNNSGYDWTGYQNILLGDPIVAWDPVASAGLSINPFSAIDFSADGSTVSYSGGTVANGGLFFPGEQEGDLFINVDLSGADPAAFVQLDFATIPTPGTISLLGIAGLVGVRLRRRKRN